MNCVYHISVYGPNKFACFSGRDPKLLHGTVGISRFNADCPGNEKTTASLADLEANYRPTDRRFIVDIYIGVSHIVSGALEQATENSKRDGPK